MLRCTLELTDREKAVTHRCLVERASRLLEPVGDTTVSGRVREARMAELMSIRSVLRKLRAVGCHDGAESEC